MNRFGWVTMDKIFLCLFNKKPCQMLFSFLRYYMHGSSLVKQFACIVATFFYINFYWKRLTMQNCESGFDPISPKIKGVSNSIVFYKNAYNGEHKAFIQFIYIHNCIRGKVLVKLYLNVEMNELVDIYPERPHSKGGSLAYLRLQGRFPAEAALINIMHEALRGHCPWVWGCDLSIGSTISDAIVCC